MWLYTEIQTPFYSVSMACMCESFVVDQLVTAGHGPHTLAGTQDASTSIPAGFLVQPPLVAAAAAAGSLGMGKVRGVDQQCSCCTWCTAVLLVQHAAMQQLTRQLHAQGS
jgi:hypothetical protein